MNTPQAAATPVWGALLVGRDVQLQDKYDFVVVGGGTSGLVIANRLTERSSKTVLVIESGPLDLGEETVLIPGFFFGNKPTEPKYTFNITSTPQPGLNNRTVGAYAAHVVGGGSAINGMFFDRGSKGDYDLWEDLGNPGWGWNNLLPYFKKSETYHPPNSPAAQELGITYDPSVHGNSGPIHASYPPFLYPATRNFLAAMKEFGTHVPRDGGSGDALGAFWLPNTLDPSSMTRSYARRGYYDPASGRSNLHLLTSTTATKILFSGKTATGVQFASSKSDPLRSVKAKSEVIIATGSQHTPQLLLLSGIGDKAFLKSLGIDVVADLPGVGQNFQDHPAVGAGGFFLNDLNPSPMNATNTTWLAEQRVLYDTQKQGYYTTCSGNMAAFLPFQEFTNRTDEFVSTLQHQNPAKYLPNSHPTIVAGIKEQFRLIIKGIRAKNLAFLEYAGSASPYMALVIEKPFSRGSVSINTTDPFADPVIDFGVFRNPLDMEVAIDSLKSWRRLLTMPSWVALGATEVNPGTNVTSYEDLVAYIRASSTPTVAHPCCTAPMMPKNLGGVVGSDLKVHGLNGLSIVDASIMPIIPSTHLVSTVYAVAEKAADIIKARNHV